MTPSIEERRLVAARLRGKCGERMFTGADVEECIGYGPHGFGGDDAAASYARLADLIDPECWARTVEDNLAMIERDRELEAELARLKGRSE